MVEGVSTAQENVHLYTFICSPDGSISKNMLLRKEEMEAWIYATLQSDQSKMSDIDLEIFNRIASAQNSHEVFLSKKAKSKMRRLLKRCTAAQKEKLFPIFKK